MQTSKEAGKLREVIAKAIEDEKITREEFDNIIFTATADGHIDAEEQALLSELQLMINNGTVKLSAK